MVDPDPLENDKAGKWDQIALSPFLDRNYLISFCIMPYNKVIYPYFEFFFKGGIPLKDDREISMLE